jgi:hypothetical protein
MKLDPRRAQERADSRMIQEDHSAMANLSPFPIHREWPRYGAFANILMDEVVYRSRTEDSDVARDVNGITPKMK